MYKRSPTLFGPFPGPRQSHTGQKRQNSLTTALTATITFKTLKPDLQDLLPNSDYTFQTLDTDPFAYASLVSKRLDNLDWLAGRGYDLYILYIHGVQYTRLKDRKVFKGSYLPVLFENMADPIISGREELGWPKLFSDIQVLRTEESYTMNTSWQGSTFGTFHMEGIESVAEGAGLESWTPPALAGEDNGIFIHRYVPAVGKPGASDADYQVWIDGAKDTEIDKTVVKRKWIAQKSTFSFDGLDWQCLPTLHHIIDKLAKLNIVEILRGELVETQGQSDLSSSSNIDDTE